MGPSRYKQAALPENMKSKAPGLNPVWSVDFIPHWHLIHHVVQFLKSSVVTLFRNMI